MKTTALEIKPYKKNSLYKEFQSCLLLSVSLLFFVSTSAQSTATIYNETIGLHNGTISADAYTGWSNGNNYSHSVPVGAAFVTNSVIPSNYSRATGGTPVTVASGGTWVIAGLNTSVYSAITLSFGIHKSNLKTSGENMHVEVSSDGVNYTTLSWPLLPTNNGSGDTWYFMEGGTAVSGSIPSATNLRIRFRNISSAPYDFDDINLKGTAVLPLRLIAFTAVKNESIINLKWVTDEETNVNSLYLQRSEVGNNFYNVRKITPRNSGMRETYSINDTFATQQIFYYRLCWVDDNGVTKYSSVIKVNLKSEQKLTLINNSFIDDIAILSSLETKESFFYLLSNVNGQTIKKGDLVIPNSGKYTIPVNSLTPGTYFLQVSNSRQQHKFKIIRQ